jgi:cytochrome c5
MKITSLFFFCLYLLISIVYADRGISVEAIEKRLKPVGKVTIAPSSNSSKAKEQKDTFTTPKQLRKAETIYQSHCVICHASGVGGAPIFQNKADWAIRFSQKGLDGLLATSKSGLNAMPPKGTCGDCSDDELLAVIKYMLPKAL